MSSRKIFRDCYNSTSLATWLFGHQRNNNTNSTEIRNNTK